MTTSNRYKILGYGICGPNERYLEQTLDCFKKLCDHTVILGNNLDRPSEDTIKSYGFDIVKDNREWGLNQNKIKEDFVGSLRKYEPQWLICLDMDEVLVTERPELEDMMDKVDSMYVFIVNLWNEGYKAKWSFWNVRVWKWNGLTRFVNRPLHCGLAPEWAYYYGSYAPLMLLHYGLKDKEVRDRKVQRYEKYDPKAKFRSREYYEGLKDDTCDVPDWEYLKSAILKDSNLIRKQMDKKEKRFVYVQNDKGFVYDIPESHMEDTLKRPGFKLIGYEDENKKKMEELFGDKVVNNE